MRCTYSKLSIKLYLFLIRRSQEIRRHKQEEVHDRKKRGYMTEIGEKA
jgi:hypothetical protein